MNTLLNIAKDEHSTRIASLGMLFLGFQENKRYSKTKLGKILDELRVSKERNITLLITKAEAIKKAEFKFESDITIDMFDFYEKGLNSQNSGELLQEIKNIFKIISNQYIEYITELENGSSDLED